MAGRITRAAHRLRMAGRHLSRAFETLTTGGAGFDAGGGGGRWPAWASLASPARQALAARPLLATRAAFLVNNAPLAASVVGVLVDALVGDGPSLRPGHPSPATQRALQAAWARFYARADAEGLSDLAGICRRVVTSLIVSGETFVRLETSDRGELHLRLISPEQIDPALNRRLDNGGEIVAGIELDDTGRRVAYHVRPPLDGPLSTSLAPPVRVLAEDICHLFEPRFPGQVRGISWLAPVATRLVELDQLEDGLVARARARVGALFAGFIRDLEGGGGGFVSDGAEGKRDPAELSLEPGVLRVLPPSTTVEFPRLPESGDIASLLRHVVRSVASALGVPYELASGDWSAVSYASSRGAIEGFRRRIVSLRGALLNPQFMLRVWERFVLLEVVSGRLAAPDFDRAPDAYVAAAINWPAPFGQLDAFRETGADIAALAAGLRSRSEIVASRGRDIADVDAELAADPLPRPTLGAQPASVQETENAAAA